MTPSSINARPEALDHIGVLTEDFDTVQRLFGDLLGLKCSEPESDPELGLAFLWLEIDGVRLEFIRPLDPHGTAAQRLRARGPGVDHLAFRVDNVASTLEELRGAGVQSAETGPRRGAHGTRIAFLTLDSTAGTRVELVQHPSKASRS